MLHARISYVVHILDVMLIILIPVSARVDSVLFLILSSSYKKQ